MSNFFGYIGKGLLVAGIGIMLLAGSSSLLYADGDPEPGNGAIVAVQECPGCTPCAGGQGDCTGNCVTAAVAGNCTVGGVECGCYKGEVQGAVCSCKT